MTSPVVQNLNVRNPTALILKSLAVIQGSSRIDVIITALRGDCTVGLCMCRLGYALTCERAAVHSWRRERVEETASKQAFQTSKQRVDRQHHSRLSHIIFD
jgi:hypothetical protein